MSAARISKARHQKSQPGENAAEIVCHGDTMPSPIRGSFRSSTARSSPETTSKMKRARCRSGSHSSTDGASKKPVSRSIWRKVLIAEPRRRIKIGLPILPNIPVMR
jgi:hypothetical protein